jgi:VCBS repeat-containing protein
VYSVTVTAEDNNGETTSQTFDWTISNPVPEAKNDADETGENGTLTVAAADGVLSNDSDPDGDTLSVSEVNGSDANVGASVPGTDGGSFTLNEDGSYTFDPGMDFDYLAVGETATTSVTYTISDGEGGTDEATLTVTINGTNDGPESTAIDSQSDNDADVISLDVSGSFSDPDTSDTLTYSAEGLPDGLTIDPDTGEITGTIDNSASQFGPDNDGVYSVTVTAEDNNGETTSQTFDWTISNPVPEAKNDADSVTEDTVLSATGNVLDNDTDPDNDTLNVDTVNGGTANVGQVVTGTYGTVTLYADGSYTYDLDNTNGDVQALAVGETLTDTFTYTITDSQGGTSTTTLTVTINGSNDAPEITLGAGDSTADDSLIETDAGLSASGTLTLSDVDTSNDVTTTALDTVTTGGTYSGPLPTDAQLFDMFNASGTLAAGDQESANGINWTFDSGSETFDFLPEGETLTLTYTVRATDSFGATDDQTVTITITGTNDTPVAVADTAAVSEDGTDQSGYDDGSADTTVIAGDVLENDSDVDDGDIFTVTGVAAGTQPSASGNVATGVTGTYGTVTLYADGSYTYDLDNTNGDVQALAVGETLTDTFTYTITDSQGGTSTTTLTVTINGSNDAPEITLGAGDSTADDSLIETDAGLSASGTLTLSDVDTSNDVTTTALDTVTTGGTYSGPLPTDAQLFDMFNASGTLAAGDQESANGINWTFDSGSETFDFLPEGETLTLTYTVRATDSFGATDDQTVTITITGTNDAGEIIYDTVSTNEDDVFNGNVLTNDIPDPDDNEDLEVLTFTVDGDGDGTQESFSAGDFVTLKTQTGGDIGTFQLNNDGSYVFTPFDNYSGPVPDITYTAGNSTFDDTATLTVTINPVSDAPDVMVDSSGIDTPEDIVVDLGVKAPDITDDIDQNGELFGDNPELLSPITLSGIPAGAVLYDGDDNAIWTSDGNPLTIVLSDQVDYHINGASGTLTLTTAQFESLKALPPQHSGENFTVTVSATSYEVDDDGNPLSGVPEATASEIVEVDVQAVTDPVDLKVDGSDAPYSTTIDEDTTLDLASLLSTDFQDLDGSEVRSIVISNPAGNDPIVVNGTTVNGGESIAINATGLSSSTTNFPDISIGGAPNFSGDLEGITVTLSARDTDSDSTHTPLEKTDSVTLNLYINPVAGDFEAVNVDTVEDTSVKFMEGLALTDTDGSEEIDSITVKAIPDGWVIKDSGGTVVHTGDGSSDHIVPAADVSSGNYQNYTITPPAHSSTDKTLTLSVQTTDTQTVDGAPQTSTITTDLDIDVTVTPKAEEVGKDTNGDGVNDLTITPGHTYTTEAAAEEDTWFSLNQDGFDLKEGWANQDEVEVGGAEETFALLTPVIDESSADGSQFRYSTDGGGTYETLTYTGTPVEIPMEYLDTVEFKAPENISGSFEIQVEAKTVDTDPDTGATNTAISGSATLANLVVLPVADDVTLATSPARGLEDTEIPLRIRPTSSDPSETYNVTISGIPDGAILRYDGVEQTVTDGTVEIEGFDKTVPLTIQPPEDSNVDFTLQVSSVSVDELNGYIDESDPATLSVNVAIKGVADSANVTTIDDPVFTEANVDDGGGRINLSDVITGAELTDTDGSESLTMTLKGLDPQFTIEGGTFLGGTGTGRTWLICKAELSDPSACPKIVVPENYSGTIEMTVRAVTTENDGNSLTGPAKPVTVTVTPSPEATMALSTTTDEDTLANLDFGIRYQNNDTNEELSSVWINEASVKGKNFTLYLGNATDTTLSDAAETPGSGVVLEEGWYKLTGDAIDNIYAKGGSNSSGEYTFDVQYEVTDSPKDETLPSVSTQTEDTYTLAVQAVTDETETSLGTFSFGTPDNASVDGTTVTATGNTSITIPVTVEQQPDPDAGSQPDTDGSERLVQFVIDGVPDGVTVEGGVYIGDTPGNPNTGQWLVEKDVTFNGTDSFTEDIVFNLDGTDDLVGGLNETITITAVTQDTGSFEIRSDTSWTLVTAEADDFGDTGAVTGHPAQIVAAAEVTDAGVTEDEPAVLNSLVDFEITGSSPFSITLTDLPQGTVVTGMTQTTVNGETVWTASGTGGDTELQALLNDITVTPPQNLNDNNTPSGFSFDVHLTTYDAGGQQNDSDLTVTPEVEPVTDPTDITVNAPDVDEGNSVTINLELSNDADGDAANIVDGKLYISLDESDMDSAGTLSYQGSEITPQTVSGVDGIPDGNYYVIDSVDSSDTLSLTYESGDTASGTVDLTASLLSQEDGADNTVPTTVEDSFTINPVNSGYEATAQNVSGDEDTPIELDIGGTGLVDTDGSESVISATLSNVPVGYLVYTGADAGSATLAANLGDDGSGNNTWSLSLDASGQLPEYVAIVPPENESGILEDIVLTMYSGENGLEPSAGTVSFDLEVIPVADGVNLLPTLTFGTEGDHIPLNLNATMIDDDGSETVTLTVKGLGQYAAFYAGGELLDFSYDQVADTYTISGIGPDEINDMTFIQSSYSGSVDVTAYTVETANNDQPDTASGSFSVNISQVTPTDGDDTFLYDGTRSFDGGDGTDTLVLRFGENIDFETDPQILNMEAIDLESSGFDHSLDNLSVQDVIDVTDGGNDFWILGNAEDTVNIVDDGWSLSGQVTENVGGVDITFDVYTHAVHSDVTLNIQQEIHDTLTSP